MYSRNQFLKQITVFGTGLPSVLNSIWNRSQIKADHKYLMFDLHAHPGRLYAGTESNIADGFDTALAVNDMKTSDMQGAFFTLVADAKLLKIGLSGVTVSGKYQPGEGWDEYKLQLQDLKKYLQKHDIPISNNGKDLKSGKSLLAFMAIEGGDFLDGKLENIEKSYADGIRSIQLVHYAPNELGDLQTSQAVFNGLSAFGKNVVKEMNRLGMVIDVAHASFETVRDVTKLTKAPIILSHSILELGADRPIAKRAISKEHAKMVADTGGVIGAWPSGFNKSFEEFVDNTMRLVDVVGIDHVGIGTDMDGNFKPVLSRYNQFLLFATALKSKGLSHQEVNKIMGKNAANLLRLVIN